MTTITIRADYEEDAREKLGKLAKKAAGYGQAITFTFPEAYGVERHTTDMFGERVAYTEWFIDVEVTGDAPRIGSHTLLAKLTREAGGVIVDKVPGTNDTTVELGRQWPGTCDHCGHDRQRNHGYIVEEAGKQVIVGRTCLRDYLGCDTPEKALWVFTFERKLGGMAADNDDWGMGSSREWYRIPRELLAATSAAIDLWGWMPSSGGEYNQTTRGRVGTLWANETYMDDDQKAQKKALQHELRANKDKHYDRADAVIAWGETIVPGASDYLHNLKLLLAAQDVKERRSGYICSAISAYERDQGRKLEAERRAKNEVEKPSHHIGKKGERIAVEATVEYIRALPADQWGDASVYTFRTDDGAKLSWLTSASGVNVDGVGKGARVKVVGTVKDHAEYKGVKETRLNRCKLEQIATTPLLEMAA